MLGSKAPKPTHAELERMGEAKQGPCVCCWILAQINELDEYLVVRQCDYHHFKSGNVRRGHQYGVALCIWHHRGYPMLGGVPRTREVYGPSLMDGSRLFHETYGSDEELLEIQNTILQGMQQ